MADDDRDDLFGDAYGAGRSDNADRWPSNEEGPAGNVDAPKTGMSNVVKILLIILAACVLGAILCCGGGYWYFSRSISTVTAPAEVNQLTQEMIAVDVPEDFTPLMGMKMNIFGVDMKMTMYQPQGDGMLQFMRLSGQALNDPQAQQQIDAQMRQQGAGSPNQVTIKDSETKTVTIDGKEVEFTFGTGTESKSNAEWKEVTGSVPSDGGMVAIRLQQPVSSYDEERVMQMLESIGTK